MPADERTALEDGISSVPFFVIDGRCGVSGAQTPETFVRVLTKAAAEREAARPRPGRRTVSSSG